MMPVRRSLPLTQVASAIALLALAGCGSDPLSPSGYDYLPMQAPVPECDDTLTIASDSPALVVNDPEVLASLSLEAVLVNLLQDGFDDTTTPLELLQRLFDSTNQSWEGAFDDGPHCDSTDNNAHANGPAALCPRVEGALAFSDGLLTPGHADHFYPVAVVNRFDLTPLGANSCGEYRVVFAKQSGLANPNDRVFLIFEGLLPNPKPGSLLACRPVAELWKSLEKETDKKVMGDKIASFLLEGLPGFTAPMTPWNLGVGTAGGAAYYNTGGQIRVSQHMDEHWEMRQLVMSHLGGGYLRFDPVPVGNNPLPGLFGPIPPWAEQVDGALEEYMEFSKEIANSSIEGLAARDLSDITMVTRADFLSGESALGGDAVNDYASRAADNQYIQTAFQSRIESLDLSADCPEDDPFTTDSALRRATMLSCAGCHAPTRFLGEERKIGCGLTWPASHGEVHIDEKGALSPALKEVFLPQRARVLETYLQACDEEAILEAFGGSPEDGVSVKSAPARTLGGRSTH